MTLVLARIPTLMALVLAAAFGPNCLGQLAQEEFAPAQGCGPDRRPEPPGEIGPCDFVEIQSKSGCMDACPIYSLRIQGDGTVLWNGKQGVQTQGLAKRQVSPEAARALIESYRTKGSGDPQHPVSSGEDGPAVITIVSTGHLTKTIGGIQNRTLFRAAGTLADTYSWIRGGPKLENVRDNLQFMSATGSISHESDFRPKPGMTDLMRAASIGDLTQLEIELVAGAKIDAQDSSGFTSLIYASWNGDPQVIRRLIKAGADVKLRSNLGQTAIMAAVAGLRPSEENSGILISSGADVNVQDHDGNSALMLAAPQSPPALVSFLLARGARKDLRDSDGHTAADIVAAQSGRTENRRAISRKLSPGSANTNGFDAGLDSRIQLLQQVRDILMRP